jgi:hypothetical protein
VNTNTNTNTNINTLVSFPSKTNPLPHKPSQMDLAALLDNLTRQVPAREVSIFTACSKIEAHINSLNREDARSLRHALPNLLKLLLGSPESA